jgi:hypothetical protein
VHDVSQPFRTEPFELITKPIFHEVVNECFHVYCNQHFGEILYERFLCNDNKVF